MTEATKTWNDYPIVLTVTQAAALLNISAGTIAAKCKSGEIPATKIGRSWSIDRDQLRAMHAPVLHERQSLAYQLGEIELALSTLAAIHRGTEIEEPIRAAHRATLKAYTQIRYARP